MTRRRHPHPDIENAIRHAEANGWTCKKSTGHAWGRLLCPWNDKECRCGEFCQISVWSTPKSPTNHAKQLRRIVDRCIHLMDEEKEEKKER